MGFSYSWRTGAVLRISSPMPNELKVPNSPEEWSNIASAIAGQALANMSENLIADNCLPLLEKQNKHALVIIHHACRSAMNVIAAHAVAGYDVSSAQLKKIEPKTPRQDPPPSPV